MIYKKITPNATKGTTIVAIRLPVVERSNTPIAPVHLPIIKLPQYKETYFEISFAC